MELQYCRTLIITDIKNNKIICSRSKRPEMAKEVYSPHCLFTYAIYMVLLRYVVISYSS